MQAVRQVQLFSSHQNRFHYVICIGQYWLKVILNGDLMPKGVFVRRPETIEKQSQSLKAFYQTPEGIALREKISRRTSEGLNRYWQSEEGMARRKQLSEDFGARMREYWRKKRLQKPKTEKPVIKKIEPKPKPVKIEPKPVIVEVKPKTPSKAEKEALRRKLLSEMKVCLILERK